MRTRFFKDVIAVQKNGKDAETIEASIHTNYKGEERIEIERTVFGPRGGKSLYWNIYLSETQLNDIAHLLRERKNASETSTSR